MKNKRQNYTLQQGCSIYHEDIHYIILQIIDLDYILAENFDTKEILRLRISEVSLNSPQIVSPKPSVIDAIADEDWNIAQQRLEIIQPLVHRSGRTTDDVRSVAKKYDLHINTLYKWLRLYEADSSLSVLSPKTRSDAGSKKLSQELEIIIERCIEEEYLSKQKKTVAALYRVIKLECRNAGLEAPHVNTVRNRVNNLANELKIRKRFSSQKAHTALHMNKGEFPHAGYPLAVVQIDHTPIDLILVDDVYRLPIERPWITLAIDVYSRIVTGFYISFEKPSALSVGMCLANSILPKDKLLAQYEIDASWPCWGVPRIVHADNAKEFRGNMLKKACQEYGFSIEWRPIGKAHFGGHIERLLGTFAKEIHALPGTTFSNTFQREGYDSEKKAAFTVKEFEHWLTVLITQSYHHNLHTGIKTTPYKKFEDGILGNKDTKGIGMAKKVDDEETLRINFLPYVERTVQDYGIRIDDIYYYSDVLRIWVNATVDGRSKLKRKFICRRDPRDISIIWFFDPQLKSYFPIPYRNTSYPAMTVWELRKIQKQLKEEGEQNVNENMIFTALEKMREIEKTAVEKTKKHRRAQQRRKHAKETSLVSEQLIKSIPKTAVQATTDDDDIMPFDEMVEVQRG